MTHRRAPFKEWLEDTKPVSRRNTSYDVAAPDVTHITNDAFATNGELGRVLLHESVHALGYSEGMANILMDSCNGSGVE